MRSTNSLNRRQWMERVGTGAAAISVGDYFLSMEAQAANQQNEIDPVVGFAMDGGPSQAAFFDAKPDALFEHSTSLDCIETGADDLVFGEILKNTSKIADRLTVIRSVTTSSNDHGIGMGQLLQHDRSQRIFHQLMADKLQDNPLGLVYLRSDFPGAGDALDIHSNGCRDDFSGKWFDLPRAIQSDWRGTNGEKFTTTVLRPTSNTEYTVPVYPDHGAYKPMNIDLQCSPTNFRDKSRLRNTLNHFTNSSRRVRDYQKQTERAVELMTGTAMKGIRWNPPEKYLQEVGDHSHSRAVWLISEFLQKGAKSIMARGGHYDTHENEASYLRKFGPRFDKPYAWLIRQMELGELPPSTVWVAGEFGRDPEVNPEMGRHHFPVQSVALYSRRLMRGAFGKTDDTWIPEGKEYPLKDIKGIVWEASGRKPLEPNQVMATKHRELFKNPAIGM